MKGMKARVLLPALVALATLLCCTIATAQKAAELDRKVDEAQAKLFASSPAAKNLAPAAKGILIFPSVKKAGFIVGGQHGEGALRIGGRTAGYYKTSAASFGLQAGGQKFGYAMFFMTAGSLEYLKKSDGWEVGVGPSIVVMDQGMGKSMTTTTMTQDVYAYIFSQKGLMGGMGVQGSKITRLD